MTKYRIFAESQIEQAKAYDGPVLIQRHCPECGDALLGPIEHEGEAPHCEEGYCGNRSGQSYVGGDIEVDEELL